MTTISAPAKPGSTLSIFRKRNFSLLWSAELVSEMGTAITSLAASIFVYQTTGSALNVGLMMIASVVPSLFVGLIAGVFVDRYNRKHIMVAADLIRALLIVAIPFLMPLNIAWLYVLIILSSAVGQFFQPALASVLPEVATEEELNAANSLMAISTFGSMAIGFAASGLIAGQYDIRWAFYLDALTFLVSAILIALVRVPPIEVEGETNVTAVVNNLKSGFKVIGGTTILRSLFLVFLPVFIIFGFMNALRLPFSIQVLQATEFEFGLLEGITLVGFVFGSLMMATLGDRLREGQWLSISLVGLGLTGITFALSGQISLAMAIIMIEGFINAPSVIARTVIIQRYTPREARGRVFSAFFVLRDVMFMLGMALAGLADVFSVDLLYLLGGVFGLGVGLLTLVMPGLGQPAAEWRRAIQLLRTAPEAPGLGLGRILAPEDFDRLAALVPALAALGRDKQKQLRSAMTLLEVSEGTAIIRQHDESDAAYFILDGKAVAGRPEEGRYRLLEVLNAGDFFGEIAALTGIPRTADVVAEQPSRLIKVPSETLREMAADPALNRMFMNRMTERMLRMNMIDLPRASGPNPAVLRDLRTPAAEPSGA